MNAPFSDRKKVRWGILGCGDVTEVKSGPGFRLAENSELVAVMRRNATLAADYARRHGVARWYDNAAQLIADPEVDAIYIATPPDAHLSAALQVAAAGKPAYVEKPMARTVGECDAMVAAFSERSLPLYVAYYRRALPRFVRAKQLVDSGELGKITSVDYRYASPAHKAEAGWRTHVASAGAGLFLDLGSHALDLIDFLLGPLTDVHGFASNRGHTYEAEDNVVMQFRAGTVPGTATWNFAAAIAGDVCRITGTEKVLEYSVFDNAPLRLSIPGGERAEEIPHPPHVQQPLIQTVVNDLLGIGTCPSTGESARRTSRVMDQVLDAYYGRRTDAFWTRPETWPGLIQRA